MKFAKTERGCPADRRSGPAAGAAAHPATAVALAAMFVVTLTGCGGGGGVAAPPPPDPPPAVSEPETPPDPPPAASEPETPPGVLRFQNHPEYYHVNDAGFAHYSLRNVRAAWAYARIAENEGAAAAPGAGVTIAVVDSGIDLDHWEFEGARISRTELNCCGPGSDPQHGTEVASIIVAQRDNARSPEPTSDFHGAAWGATVKVFPLNLEGVGEEIYTPITISELDEEDLFEANFLDEVLAADGVDIVNMSFGFPGLIENYEEPELRGSLDDFIRVAAQRNKNAGDRVLLVRAAGNDNGYPCAAGTDNCIRNETGDATVVPRLIDASSPTVMGGLPVHIEELRGHYVAVVATNGNDTIADFSNRCGIAARWCVAAPGEGIRAAFSGPGPEPGQERERSYSHQFGSSYSAPLIAAGLALLKQYFRDQLGHDEIMERLLTTARVTPDPVPDGMRCPDYLDLDGDLSTCELSSALGRGIMDLDAATRPVGTVAVVLGESVDGARVPATASALRGGTAFGDAFAAALRGREMAVFDELGAPFWIDPGGFAASSARPSLESRLKRLMTGERRESGAVPFASGRLAINRESADDAWGGGHMSLAPLADGGLSLTGGEEWRISAFVASRNFGRDKRGRTAGASLAWKPDDGPLGARLGLIREFERAAGAAAAGALGNLASNTAFVGADFRADLRDWSLFATAELGLVDAGLQPGLVQGISTLRTSALAVSGERSLSGGGLLRLSLSRPLRVEKGRLKLMIPIGRNRRGDLLRETVEAPLRPSGQQIDAAAAWHRPIGRGELRLGSILSFQPGHRTKNSPELALLTGLRLPF